jgi:hypothetical protein
MNNETSSHQIVSEKNPKNVLLCERELLQESAISNLGGITRIFSKFLSSNLATPLASRKRPVGLRRFHRLFGGIAGALMFAGALVPRADADAIVYFNFEGNTFTSVPAPGPGGMYPFLQNQTILNSPTDPFPAGGLLLTPAVGTTLNQLAGDVPTTNSALSLRGNTQGTANMDCFRFGVNTTGYAQASLSFALQSLGNGTQFSQIEVQYSTNGGATFTVTPEGLVAINRDGLYHIYTFDISGADNTANALIEVCFTGSTTNNVLNVTNLDNLQINAIVPEPATVAGGVLGVMGLCWHQRRRLIRSLLPRRSCTKAGRWHRT